jgi:phospholipid N-methyltransferase
MVECTLDKREVSSSSLLRLKWSSSSSVVEHWTENPRVVGSIPTLSKSLLGGMVDALDLKSSSFWSIGSSPVAGIRDVA